MSDNLLDKEKAGTVNNLKKFQALSTVIQTSFGLSSQTKKPSTHFLKADLVSEDLMRIHVRTIVTFGHQKVWQELERKHTAESLEVVKKMLEKIKKDYEEHVKMLNSVAEPKKEPYAKEAPKTVKLSVIPTSVSHNLTLLTTAEYSAAKTAVFTLNVSVKVD